jgi:hypothetical protein
MESRYGIIAVDESDIDNEMFELAYAGVFDCPDCQDTGEVDADEYDHTTGELIGVGTLTKTCICKLNSDDL